MFLKNLEASMSILSAMFETLFKTYCSVCFSESFFLLLQHCKNAKEKTQAFSKLNNCHKNFLSACAEQQRSIILNSCNFACKHKKITKFYCFESAQIVVSFTDLSFVFFCFWFILLPSLALFIICS